MYIYIYVLFIHVAIHIYIYIYIYIPARTSRTPLDSGPSLSGGGGPDVDLPATRAPDEDLSAA